MFSDTGVVTSNYCFSVGFVFCFGTSKFPSAWRLVVFIPCIEENIYLLLEPQTRLWTPQCVSVILHNMFWMRCQG